MTDSSENLQDCSQVPYESESSKKIGVFGWKNHFSNRFWYRHLKKSSKFDQFSKNLWSNFRNDILLCCGGFIDQTCPCRVYSRGIGGKRACVVLKTVSVRFRCQLPKKHRNWIEFWRICAPISKLNFPLCQPCCRPNMFLWALFQRDTGLPRWNLFFSIGIWTNKNLSNFRKFMLPNSNFDFRWLPKSNISIWYFRRKIQSICLFYPFS